MRFASILAAAAGLAVGFFSYGRVRTMLDTVGFDATATLAGLLFGVAFPYAVAYMAVLATRALGGAKLVLTPSASFVAFGIGIALGGVASETWLLVDEAQFAAEVRDGGQEPLRRARAWPNGGCALIYVPGEGTHATD